MLRIAIDGPGGAGKSTIAKAVARRLNIKYVDTGAMYRGIGYKMLSKGIAVSEDEERLRDMLEETEMYFRGDRLYIDGQDVSEEIRSPEVSEMASSCSAVPMVREKLVALQKQMGQGENVVMDGRDIGTNVMPHAEYKFFMTATAQERAKRRYDQLRETGETVTPEQVLEDINRRDKRDTTRKLNPLRKADDAVEIDTTGMSIDEVTETILQEVKQWQS